MAFTVDDCTIEVRGGDMKRKGILLPKSVRLAVDIRRNNVGTYKLDVPADHVLAPDLRAPGAGIILTFGGEVVMSGPIVRPIFTATNEDPGGTLYFDGVTDDIHLADRLAYPQPSNPDAATQNVDEDKRTGPAETLMHAFVNANIGPDAPAARRIPHLLMGTDGGRGAVTTKSARFPVLGELVDQLSAPESLRFSVVQRGDNLVFETAATRDLSRDIRLDVHNNTLAGQKLTVSAPEITRVIIAGKNPRQSIENPPDAEGNPTPNTVIEESIFLIDYTEARSTEAESDWNRRIERFITNHGTNDMAELHQTGAEALAEKGYTAVSVEVVPMINSSMQFGRDWGLGDKVGVIVDGIEHFSIVTGYKVNVSTGGVFVSVDLGDPADFDPSVALRKRVQTTGRRLSALERTK